MIDFVDLLIVVKDLQRCLFTTSLCKNVNKLIYRSCTAYNKCFVDIFLANLLPKNDYVQDKAVVT